MTTVCISCSGSELSVKSFTNNKLAHSRDYASIYVAEEEEEEDASNCTRGQPVDKQK